MKRSFHKISLFISLFFFFLLIFKSLSTNDFNKLRQKPKYRLYLKKSRRALQTRFVSDLYSVMMKHILAFLVKYIFVLYHNMVERTVLKNSKEDGPFNFRVPVVTVKISNETIVDSQVKKCNKIKKRITLYTIKSIHDSHAIYFAFLILPLLFAFSP